MSFEKPIEISITLLLLLLLLYSGNWWQWVLMAKLKTFWNGNNNNIVGVDVV